MNQFHFIDMQCTADSTSEIIPFNTGRKDNSHIIFTSFQFIFIYSFSSLCHKWQIKLRPLIRFLPVFLINASYGYQIRMIKTVRCIQCFCLFICLVKDCINIPRILFIFYNISILIFINFTCLITYNTPSSRSVYARTELRTLLLSMGRSMRSLH